jgi:hypothetical protein
MLVCLVLAAAVCRQAGQILMYLIDWRLLKWLQSTSGADALGEIVKFSVHMCQYVMHKHHMMQVRLFMGSYCCLLAGL